MQHRARSVGRRAMAGCAAAGAACAEGPLVVSPPRPEACAAAGLVSLDRRRIWPAGPDDHRLGVGARPAPAERVRSAGYRGLRATRGLGRGQVQPAGLRGLPVGMSGQGQGPSWPWRLSMGRPTWPLPGAVGRAVLRRTRWQAGSVGGFVPPADGAVVGAALLRARRSRMAGWVQP